METNEQQTVEPHADPPAIIEEISAAGQISQEDHERHFRKKHEDHSVSRKYRMFSNHSSAGDMPRTITGL